MRGVYSSAGYNRVRGIFANLRYLKFFAAVADKLAGDDGSIGGMSRTVLLAIALPCAAVLVALVVLLGVYCVRHRRLQHSFASYASSHYDRRANSATLNDLGTTEPDCQSIIYQLLIDKVVRQSGESMSELLSELSE